MTTQDRAVGEAGWVMVPREPTEAMKEAGLEESGNRVTASPAEPERGELEFPQEDADHINAFLREACADTYRAMLNAAPAPVVGEREAFEAWAETYIVGDLTTLLVWHKPSQDYLGHFARHLWAAWQARASIPVQDAKPVKTEPKAKAESEAEQRVQIPRPGQARSTPPATGEARKALTERARPLEEWHEDMGPQLWWKFPIVEPPYCGSPLDCGQTVEAHGHAGFLGRFQVGGWPGHHTHFTPIVTPEEP